MSLDSAAHWGGTEGLNPVQHKQYQCHHFFFFMHWLVVLLSPELLQSSLMFMHTMRAPLPPFPHPPTTPPQSCRCLCLVCLHRLVPLDRVSHKWHGYGVCFGKSHSGAVGV